MSNPLFTKNNYNHLENGLYAILQTSKGEITLELEFEKVPLTVANFVGLIEGTIKSSRQQKKFYDGLTFHRVVNNFVIQGGDPAGNGTGGPGYSFSDEFHPSLTHSNPGILSMANSGPHSNGSQFFITLSATPWLDNKHSVFGKVKSGMEVVKEIKQGDKIEKAIVVRRGTTAKNFKVTQTYFDNLNKKNQKQDQLVDKKKLAQILKSTFSDYKATQDDGNGIFYQIIKKGKGQTPPPGTKVLVHYRGKFINGEEFDSSYQRNQPFSFYLGQGQVIRGWDKILSKMKKGEKRIVLLPPEMAYGSRGAGKVIPPNAFLIFEIELIDF